MQALWAHYGQLAKTKRYSTDATECEAGGQASLGVFIVHPGCSITPSHRHTLGLRWQCSISSMGERVCDPCGNRCKGSERLWPPSWQRLFKGCTSSATPRVGILPTSPTLSPIWGLILIWGTLPSVPFFEPPCLLFWLPSAPGSHLCECPEWEGHSLHYCPFLSLSPMARGHKGWGGGDSKKHPRVCPKTQNRILALSLTWYGAFWHRTCAWVSASWGIWCVYVGAELGGGTVGLAVPKSCPMWCFVCRGPGVPGTVVCDGWTQCGFFHLSLLSTDGTVRRWVGTQGSIGGPWVLRAHSSGPLGTAFLLPDTNYLKWLFPTSMRSNLYRICYSPWGQEFSICNYWHGE